MRPATADAAAVAGLIRCTMPPRPIRPLKFRFEVEAQTSPSASTPAAIAAGSAQLPSGKAAFSTLQPGTTVPSAVSRAAPTRNREYGAYACAIAAFAAFVWWGFFTD